MLHAYKTITSVTLTTDAFNRDRYPDRWERFLVFLASLPVGICHVRLTYHRHRWGSDADLTEKVRRVDWAAIGQKLDAYASLGSVEVGVSRALYVPDSFFVDNASARAVVLQRFPARI